MTASTPTTNVKTLSVGDTVSFHYALSNIDGKLYTGRVIEPIKHSALWGDVVLIEPMVNEYHLPPRHVSVERIVSVVATAPVIEDTPVDDVLVTLAKISAAYVAWETAWLANPKSELTARLSDEHDRLLDAYMVSIGAKKARIQGKEGVSSPSTASQVTSIEMDAQPAEIASTRDCEASGLTRELDRHQQKERRWASDAAQQFGIAPSTAPRPPVMTIVKPTRAMNATEQASHDALQAMIRAAGGGA